ncbi:MAG TPA: D-alanine--D-alanine ligase family protein [Pyrinomonadaceae bacterium]|nr:D-alanine--D-alanine ligase family protein [Pyrinomonadaceae bacterium]
MAKKLRVGVIFGGRSGEHEVSIRSAASVIQAIDTKKYEIVPIAISREGKWLSAAEAFRLLPANAQSFLPSRPGPDSGAALAILGDPSRTGLLSLEHNGSAVTSKKLDVVFPVLHGPFGEDGTLQGLLEMANLPYVGCGVLASACGMDKVAMKLLFLQAGLPMCNYIWFLRSHWQKDRGGVIKSITRKIGLPCFVKPANLGSSVGVSRADDRESLKRAVDLAAQYDRKIVVEEAVDAREIECAVIGNDEPRASLPGEYVVHDESARFLDYTEKYTTTGRVAFVVPAPIPKALTTRIQKMALQAFRAVDGAGLARVDFFLKRGSSELLINELNTMPGLTEVSGYPKMWAASGLTYSQMLDVLIDLALQRHREKSLTRVDRM